MANGLVTEQPQYSVIVCFFSTWQNTEILLIPNGLRFIFTYSPFLALPILLHVARHTFAVLALNDGMQMSVVSRLLGHASTGVTEKVYAKYLPETLEEEVNRLNFGFLAS